MKHETINVLILSAGRRVELTRCFIRARDELDVQGKIVAVDICELAPALYFADAFYLVPRVTEDTYVQSLIDICNKENICLIVPTIDTELLILMENREYIESNTQAKILLSNDDVIRICRDKNNTQRFFENNGFGVPVRYTVENIEKQQISFPLFIKPKDGSSSINAYKVNSMKELRFFAEYIEQPIIQEFISGTEYSVDVFCDFEGNLVTVVPRERIAMRGGEIAKGKIVKDRKLIDDVKKMIEILKPIGQITIQCMKTEIGIVYIEINPRFGGGAPMSIAAGADSCKNLYRLLRGEKLSYYEDYTENICLRFDDCIFFNMNMEKLDD